MAGFDGTARMGTRMPQTTAKKSDYLEHWDPENEEFFDRTGSKIAWRTLIVSTFCLTLAFTTWFVVSALVVKLRGLGFNLTQSQEFWLLAMPGLAAGTLRIVHTFLVPIIGTRKTVVWSTILLLIPAAGWAYVIQHPETPYGVLLLLAFLAGMGGGNFSSFMPSTSLFFPKRKLGTALGIQAGVSNFGVSLVQIVTPLVMGFGIFTAGQTYTEKGQTSTLWLENAVLIWVPFIVVGTIWAYFALRSVPVKASFREQADILKHPHTWLMTSIYMMTFGTFSGLAATFPKLIHDLYGGFDNAPLPLRFAFLGPFIGAGVRVVFGPISDKFGGARVTLFGAIGLTISAFAVTFFTHPTSLAEFPGFLWSMLILFFFTGVGNAAVFKQIPMIFAQRQAAGVIGWVSAIAAYGPFLVSMALAWSLAATGHVNAFFYGTSIFCLLNAFVVWYFYVSKRAVHVT